MARKSQATDLTAGGATETDLSKLPDAFEAIFGTVAQGDVKEITDQLPWGGSETTYYDASGAVLGYKFSDSHTYQDPDGTSQTSTNVSYENANRDYIGHSYSDSYGSGSSFMVEKVASADNTPVTGLSSGDKYFEESGTSSWTDSYGSGGTETREFTYYYEYDSGAMGSFLGGTETNNGETLTFNANWSVAARSQSVDTDDALTDTSGLPDALVAQSGDTYASTENFTWGSETTYYDLTGTVLGYSNVNTWSYDDNGTTVSGTNTNYNDADWNHLGSSWSDAYGSGSMIMSTGTDTGGTLTGVDGIAYRKEVNTFTDADGNTSTSTYYFNDDSNDTEDGADGTVFGDLLKGTEVFGATTINYGPKWAIASQATDLTAGGATETDLSKLPDAFEAIFGTVAQGDVKEITDQLPWGGSETTYYDASGAVLGYKFSDSHTYQDPDGTSQTSTNVSYENANRDYIGHSYSDSYGSGSSFMVEKVASADNTPVTGLSSGDKYFEESGTSSWTDSYGSGGTETREFTYYYEYDSGAMGSFLGGTETNNGETLTFNANWSVAARSQSVDTEDALTDTSGLPDALVAQSGDTYASTENFTWGSETTYYDSTGTVLGYSNVNTWSYDDNGTTVSGTNTNYNDADWNHLGSSWSDAYGSGSMIMSTGTDTGGTLTGVDGIAYRKEVNTFTDADGNTSTSTYYFNDDSNDSEDGADGTVFGDLLKGTEVFGATTINYGPKWAIASQATDLTAGGATETDLSKLPDAFEAIFGTVAQGDVKEITDQLPWGGSETTYYDASGAVLGYKFSDSHTYQDPDGTSQTSTNVSYENANRDYIGHSYSDSYGSGSSFMVEKVASADNTPVTGLSSGDKYFEESGTSSWTDSYGSGGTETREFTYYYEYDSGAMGSFLGGTETNNGETLTFNANWSVAARSQSVDADDALTDTSGLPDALVAQSGDTYASTENFTWGSETTYYDLTGTVLGYSNVNTWSYDDNGTTVSGTNTNYNDADWNHLGSSWSDAYGSGSMIMSTGTDTGGTLTGVDGIAYRKEVNTFTDADGNTSTSTYYFNDDSNDTEDGADGTVFGDLLKGTEVFGATTINYGPKWAIASQATDLTAGGATETDLSKLPDAFEAIFGTVAQGDVKEITDQLPWGGSETTYYDASGAVLGYKFSDSHTYQDPDGTSQTSTNVSYENANRDYIGHSYSDSYGSGSSFMVEKVASADNTPVAGLSSGDKYFEESGTSSWTDSYGSGGTETREFTYYYEYDSGAMGSFLGGTETNNGETINFDGNWNVTGQSKTVEAGAIALTATELEGVPAALQSTQNDDGQGNGYTYADVEDFGYGSETMYYDSTGTILGYANANSYSGDYGSGSNVSYRDANDNDLGSSYEDYDASGTLMSKGSTIVSFGNDTAGDVFDSAVKYRKVVNTMEDLDGSTQTSTYYYNNDDTDNTPPTTMPEPADMTVADTIYGQLMAGFEEMGATTRELGPNGYVKGEKADLTNLQVADLSNLPTAFVDAAIGTGTQTPIEIDVTRDSTSGTLFFDGAAIPDGFTINEGDIYIFDTSDSMAGYSIGFAESKDNSNNDAIGASDGVTISGVPGGWGECKDNRSTGFRLWWRPGQ